METKHTHTWWQWERESGKEFNINHIDAQHIPWWWCIIYILFYICFFNLPKRAITMSANFLLCCSYVIKMESKDCDTYTDTKLVFWVFITNGKWMRENGHYWKRLPSFCSSKYEKQELQFGRIKGLKWLLFFFFFLFQCHSTHRHISALYVIHVP